MSLGHIHRKSTSNFFLISFLLISFLNEAQVFSASNAIQDGYILIEISQNFTSFNELSWNSYPVAGESPCTKSWRYVYCENGDIVEVNLEGLGIGGIIIPKIGQLSSVKILNFAHNKFKGEIPSGIGNLNSLRVLDLSKNEFSGTIPESLGKMKNIKKINLSHNLLIGKVPTSLKRFPCSFFEGNSNLYCSNDSKNTYKRNSHLASILSLTFIGGLIFFAILILLKLPSSTSFRLIHNNSNVNSKVVYNEEIDFPGGLSKKTFSQLREFTFKEIATFTSNFSRKNELGEGNYGKVYLGKLENQNYIAVKRFKLERRVADQPLFLNQVEMISLSSHRNLLRLIGYCVEKGERMLVFPYMSNGSVASHFKGKKYGCQTLSWSMRQKIAVGTACGLSYMHVDCNPRLIHRDIKADNVLLDEDWEPVICDFGLTKFIDPLVTHATTSVKGTICHIAPEYLSSGQTSEKTDVFSFGVFLLELVSGKAAIDIASSTDTEDLSLEEWMMKCMDEGRLDAIIDPGLSKEISAHEVEYVLRVALLCMQIDSVERPTMSECLSMLQGNGLAEKWERWRSCSIFADQVAIGIPSSSRSGRKWATDSEIGFDGFSFNRM